LQGKESCVNEYSDSKITHLEKTVQNLRRELATSQREAGQREASLQKTIESLQTQLSELQQKQTQMDGVLRTHEQNHHCETLYSVGRTFEAALFLVQITNTMSEEVQSNKFLMDWFTDFTNLCVSALEKIGDDALSAEKHDEALEAFSTILSFGSGAPESVLAKWTSTMMSHSSVNETLRAAGKFKLPRFMFFQAICDILLRDGRTSEAVACLNLMQSELTESVGEQGHWELGFRQRLAVELGKLLDHSPSSR